LEEKRTHSMARQSESAYERGPGGNGAGDGHDDNRDRRERLPSLSLPTLPLPTLPLPTLPLPTLSFLHGRTARQIGPWLLLLTLAVAAFPAATGGFKASPASAANAGVRPNDLSSYAVIDLGASTTGFTVSGATAYAINNNNQVVGDYYDSGGSSHAFIWNPTGPSTGAMSDPGIGGGSHAYGINDRGRVVGQGAGGAYIAIPPTSAGSYTVTTLVGGGVAYGINSLDAVVGTSGGHAFIRTADPHNPSAVGNVTTIGDSGCGSSDGRAINGFGAIVGSACGSYAASSDGSSPMRYIGSLGGRASRTYALNESGQAGGYSYVPGNYEVHAVLWDPSSSGKPYPVLFSTHTDLGTIGGSFATILGLNTNGAAVGYGTTFAGAAHAVISRAGGSLSDLNDFITPGSNWTITHAYAINDNGVIVGDARDANNSGPMHAVYHLKNTGADILGPMSRRAVE